MKVTQRCGFIITNCSIPDLSIQLKQDRAAFVRMIIRQIGWNSPTSDVNKDLGFKAKAKAKAKDLGFKAMAKAKDLSFKAKAKDLSAKAKAKDLTFYQGQGHKIWSLRTSKTKI